MKKTTIKKRSIWSIIIVLIIAGLGYIITMEYIIPGFEKIFAANTAIRIQDIKLALVPIISYIIIAVFVCFAVRIFKELKKPKEKEGLIWGFILGVVGAVIWGFIWVGISIAAIEADIIMNTTKGPIIGFTVGLVICFYGGFFAGVMTEFDDNEAYYDYEGGDEIFFGTYYGSHFGTNYWNLK